MESYGLASCTPEYSVASRDWVAINVICRMGYRTFHLFQEIYGLIKVLFWFVPKSALCG